MPSTPPASRPTFQRFTWLQGDIRTWFSSPAANRLRFIIGVILLFLEKRRRYQKAGLLLAVVAALLAVNTHPFRSSPYDQYMGDLGIAPYQYYIDYVKSRGGMVFWNYPETRSGVRRMGPVQLDTRAYPNVLEEAERGKRAFRFMEGPVFTNILLADEINRRPPATRGLPPSTATPSRSPSRVRSGIACCSPIAGANAGSRCGAFPQRTITRSPEQPAFSAIFRRFCWWRKRRP